MISGLPVKLTNLLRDLLELNIFIETGTGLGRTTDIAMDIFKRVYTIEAHEGRWRQANRRFRDDGNVTCIHGQSPGALSTLLEELDHHQSVIFLDAHCGYRKSVTDDDCPLLAEIETVRQSNVDHVIIIDDEHAFTSVPHNLAHRNHYPELPQVVDALRGWSQIAPYIIIEGKCIVAVPRWIKEQVDSFLHHEKFDHGDNGQLQDA